MRGGKNRVETQQELGLNLSMRRTLKGPYLGQGGKPVSGDQMQVRSHESALSGQAKNTAQLQTLFALYNLWWARRKGLLE